MLLLPVLNYSCPALSTHFFFFFLGGGGGNPNNSDTIFKDKEGSQLMEEKQQSTLAVRKSQCMLSFIFKDDHSVKVDQVVGL